MIARWHSISGLVGLLSLLVFLSACGGGDSSSPPPSSPSLVISTDSVLPGGLQNRIYSVTLSATNGVGALKWSIQPISSTGLFVDGLTIDPSSGVISGSLNFGGTGGFQATVTDSASPPHTARKGFTITANGPLQAPSPQTFQVGQFNDALNVAFGPFGGVAPLNIRVTSGSIPFGLKIENHHTQDDHYVVITGSPNQIGTYPITVTVQDSFTPPEVVSAQFTIQVIPPPLTVMESLPRKMTLNQPFNGKVIATGGVPPYTFAFMSGTIPPGLSSVDPSGGQINGTPTRAGSYFFEISATDSSSVPQTASLGFGITVAGALGRNDTVATATPIDNGQFDASLSPYIDPPGNAPLAGDNDYYKVVSLSGATVHVETFASRGCCQLPTDTVLEIVDGNSSRLATCNQPGGPTVNFSSACINDDLSDGSDLDSALDIKVPGPANMPTTFYVHVLDWRGDARPDMRYSLLVNGGVAPLGIDLTPLLPAWRGLPYSQQLVATNNIGTVSWSLASGSLPPNLNLSSAGAITGSATTNGTYTFTAKATDSGAPPQTKTAQQTIRVGDPVVITSSPRLPDACLHQPYSFTPHASGGIPPLLWTFFSNSWVLPLDQTTGTFSGTPAVLGTFTGSVGVNDATTNGDGQQISLTVKSCP